MGRSNILIHGNLESKSYVADRTTDEQDLDTIQNIVYEVAYMKFLKNYIITASINFIVMYGFAYMFSSCTLLKIKRESAVLDAGNLAGFQRMRARVEHLRDLCTVGTTLMATAVQHVFLQEQ